MKVLKDILLSNPKRKLEELSLLLFLLFLPTQLSYHFWTSFSFINGIRVDFLSPTLYLTDIFLIVPFLFNAKSFFLFLFSHKKTIALIFVFAVVNTLFATTPLLAFYKWIKVLEFLFVFFLAREKKAFIKRHIVLIFFFILALTTILSVWQIYLGRSVGGIFYYLGERSFFVSTPGISLVNLNGYSFLRPYATFSHPNSLAGFVLLSLFLVLSFANKLSTKVVFLALSLFLIVLSYSQSACLAFILSFLFLIFTRAKPVQSKILSFFLLGSVFVSLILPVFIFHYVAFVAPLSKSVSERIDLIFSSLGFFLKNPVFGVGLLNSIDKTLRQPVHNLYWLALAEVGVVGLLFFTFAARKVVKKGNGNIYFSAAILSFLIISFFDHYFFTLQQNTLLLALSLGLFLKRGADARI